MPHRPSWLSTRTVTRTALLAMALVPIIETAAQESTRAQGTTGQPTSLFDPRLNELRRASVTWDTRTGPTRQVADIVCLVPDVPTFLDAIAAWDDGHYFPILIEDTEYTPKFLRAFRPAKVVHFPTLSDPIPADQLWAAAMAAVGRSWVDEKAGAEALPGDRVPKLSPPATPGIVLSEPEAPSLAGAVALAAGRFQPLLLWDVQERVGDVLSMERASALAGEVEAMVAALIPKYDRLGDECDFLTLAGDWPYRFDFQIGEVADLYKSKIGFDVRGTAVFDELIGRRGDLLRSRWAYTGRLIGDERASVYRAMCALFLQPDSALLFNGYAQENAPWTDYRMEQAAQRLARADLSVVEISGANEANREGWHRTFDPRNRSDLVMINSSGGPDTFNLPGGAGFTDDVPETDPTAVLMIHSFSAANPYDPNTIAGRWLANGAFIYFGSVNEPLLSAFRSPTLLAELIVEDLPMVTAVRQMPGGELFGIPWRLIYIGDPLYRLLPPELRPERVEWPLVANWPAHEVPPIPTGPDVSEAQKLNWSIHKAIQSASRGSSVPPEEILTRAVLAIRREGLSPEQQRSFDALAIDTLTPYSDHAPLRRLYARTKAEELPDQFRGRLRSSVLVDFERTLGRSNPMAIGATWTELMRTTLPDSIKQDATARVGHTLEAQGRLQDWDGRLRSTLRSDPSATFLQTELDRVAPKIQAEPPRARETSGRSGNARSR